MTNTRPITEKQRARFLECLVATCNVTAAAKAAGVGRRTVYSLRDRDQTFREAWFAAEQEAVDQLEAEAFRIARDGVTETTYDGAGQVVSTRKREDSRLIMWLLAAHRPKVYSEKTRFEIDGRVSVEHELASGPVITIDDVIAAQLERRRELEAGELIGEEDGDAT